MKNNSQNSILNFQLMLIILLVISANLFAQYTDHRNPQIDSLEQVLVTNQPADEELARIYRMLMWEYLSLNGEKSMDYARKCIILSIPYDGWNFTSQSYMVLGMHHNAMSQYDSAFVYYDKALEATERMKNFPQKYSEADIDYRFSVIYGNMGNVYNYQAQCHEAIEYYFKALKIFEKYDNIYDMVFFHNNIGQIFQFLDVINQAETHFLKSDSLAHIINDSLLIVSAKRNLGSLYLYTKDYDKALQNVETAYGYYLSHPEKEKYWKAYTLTLLAEIFLEGYDDLEQAEEYAQQALDILKEAKLDLPRDKAISLRLLSTVYLKRKQWHRAEQTALEALSTDDSEPANTLALYGILTKAYAKLGNSDKVYEYFDKHNELQSSWTSKNYQSAIREMEVKYETEKKETQIATLETKNQLLASEKRLMILLGFAGGGVLLFGLAISLLLWRGTMQKRRFAEQQVKQLEQEKQLIATQSVLDGEIQERTRLARDLHDGLGSMLTGVKFNLETLKNNVIFAPNEVKNFDNAMTILADSMHEMRRMAHNLMPNSLTRFGLKVALKDFCRHFPVIEFAWFGSEERLPELNRELMIYRIIHELVNNALKHSGATKITVHVMNENDYIAFTVYDNGRGFDLEQQTQGMGLRNIRERVAACNGRMELDTGAEKGTEINVEFRKESHGGN